MFIADMFAEVQAKILGETFMSNVTQMSQEMKTELDRYVSFISELDGVIQVYLFGSFAYGIPTTDSDVDLLVVVQDGIDPIKMMREVKRGLQNKIVPFDILVINHTDFAERSKPDRVTLQREIKNRGVLVHGE